MNAGQNKLLPLSEGRMDWCIVVGEVSGILLRSTYWKDSEGQTEHVPGGGRNSHTVFDPADLTRNWQTNINLTPEERGGKRQKNLPRKFALYMLATYLKKHRSALS